jgi:YVTN family beta-propeller protein
MGVTTKSEVVVDATSHAFISDPAANQIQVLDLRTLAVGTPIPVGPQPQGLALTPDGTRLYVADSGSREISVVDVAARREDHRFVIPTTTVNQGNPYSIAIANNGKALVVMSQAFTGGIALVQIDLATEGSTVRPEVGSLAGTTRVAASGDRSHIAMFEGDSTPGSVFLYDASTDSFTPRHFLNGFLNNVSLNQNGSTIYADQGTSTQPPQTFVLDGTLAQKASIPGSAISTTEDPAAAIAFRVQGAFLEIVDLTRNTINLNTGIAIPKGAGTATGGAAFAPDGTIFVVLTTNGAFVVSVAPTVTIAGPPDPSGDAFQVLSFTAADPDDPGAPLATSCSLDGAVPGPCGSPVTYMNLGAGRHTFTAQASDPGGETGSASYSWTVNAPVATPPPPPPPPPPAPAPRDGYWMLASNGMVFVFGDAIGRGGDAKLPPGAVATAIAPVATGAGFWVVDDRGDVFGSLKVPTYGGNPPRNAGENITSISSTADGKGYWLFSSQGRVFAYGDAAYFGDMGAIRLNGPVLGSVATPSGRGYYMVASDGGIFAFGDATFAGSMGGRRLNGPIVGLAPNPAGTGYWLVASDGGIFAFGSPFKGSMASVPLNRPVIGLVAYGDGYLMVGSDGGIFDFSNKAFLGSLGGSNMTRAVVGVAPVLAGS